MFPTPLRIILFMFLSVNRSIIRISKLPKMANIITPTPQKFMALCGILGLCGIGVLNGSTKIANTNEAPNHFEQMQQVLVR